MKAGVEYRRVRALAAGLRAARAQRDELLRATESLVHGVEDSVLRFLDSHALSLRADMELVLRARVERARAAIAKTRAGK